MHTAKQAINTFLLSIFVYLVTNYVDKNIYTLAWPHTSRDTNGQIVAGRLLLCLPFPCVSRCHSFRARRSAPVAMAMMALIAGARAVLCVWVAENAAAIEQRWKWQNGGTPFLTRFGFRMELCARHFDHATFANNSRLTVEEASTAHSLSSHIRIYIWNGPHRNANTEETMRWMESMLAEKKKTRTYTIELCLRCGEMVIWYYFVSVRRCARLRVDGEKTCVRVCECVSESAHVYMRQ